MRLFEEPKMEVVKFSVEDIVTTSGGDEGSITTFGDTCF